MAQLVVQSRFAGLKIEDDDYPPTENQKSKKSKVNNTKKTEPPKKQKNVTNKPQPGPKKKKSKPQQVSADQWELWKQKDEEMVVGHFEDELQQAILLSKLDFEKEEGRVYLQTKENAELEETINELSKQEAKKLKKKNVMSLDQFNDMMNAGEELKLPPHANEKCVQEVPKSPIKDPGFFDRVKAETKKELLKEKVVDKPRAQPPISNEVITRLQFTDALDRKDQEIATLKEEVENLKHELFTVKCRNKKLCNILGQGEMKDKAEVLIEVERLRSVQAELTAELASLHTDLEKERSKNTDPRAHKDKKNTTKKKNIRFDVSSEALVAKDSSSGTG
ncbi:unnamed protein product [Spodoptera exigua]|nr:unnamed protein product [Spodoptera exigua]